MVGSQWTSSEQKDYLETQFSEFLKQQLQGTLLNFWSTVSMEFLNRWPEIDVLYPDKTLSQLSEAENVVLGKAVEARKKQIKNWFNYRSRKGGRSQLNAMTKSITKMLGNKAKGTRALTEVEIFSKLNYDTAVRSQIKEKIEAGLLVTKNEKLLAVKESTKAAYEAAPSEIRSLCKAKAAEEREAKASVVLSEAAATGTPTNAQYAKALEECIGPISQFFDALRQLTGWEWSVIGGGPDPRLGGMLNVSSYHTGVNQSGLTWKQATSNFTDKHLNPYLSYLGTVFTEDDRKKRALDYVLPVEQEENSWRQEAEAPTMSDASTSLQVALSSPAVATACDSQQAVNSVFDESLLPFDSPGPSEASRFSSQGKGKEAATGVPAVPESLLPFDSPGPSRFSSQGIDDLYSWALGTPLPSSVPWPQTPILPAFPSTSSVPPLPLTSPDTPITSWRKDPELWNTTRDLTSPAVPSVTAPMYNFDGCSISSSINPQQIPVLPYPIATDQLTDEVIRPAATVAQLTVVTSVDLTAMDAPTAEAPTTVIDAGIAATAPTTSHVRAVAMVQGTGMELPTMDTTTTSVPAVVTITVDTPAPQFAAVQSEEDMPVAADQGVVRKSKGGKKGVEQRRPQTARIQPSNSSPPSVNVPLRKTGRVRQESTRMAQANTIGESAKRHRTGEAENALQKKKRKSYA
ncbi:hypothetical protein DEU56DRAFT_914724 [Suillus clintonianus]|uniref:uncharacterized protein n=1 Tax=Suillus clintonianus TaxID=1904413 RepID=UPI001B869CF9|nr:uncharacterized protein DEU56DRAFT_914724 [Suillus clintonianus]KAG2130726.1 hypothetical protein DEU56DRAFT_914724 [Suillus clintonianus]